MTTAAASHTEIHTDPQYEPLPAAAGMFLFHKQMISNLDIHGMHTSKIQNG